MSAGSFIWYELMTHDPDAAARFYGAVVGWKISDAPAPMPNGADYRMIMRGDGGSAGGVLRLSQDMLRNGAQPCWLGYLHVADVNASIQAMVADGARVVMPGMDLPVGRIAMVADPMGTPFYVMKPIPPPGKPEAKSDVFDVKEPQRIRWNELASPDLARARTFYAKHFHFQFNDVMPMGPMGDYCFIDHDGVRLGAIMQKPAESPGPTGTWLFYFGVPSIAEAERAITANGGKVLQGQHEVPGGDWVVVATDPAGAAFGVVGPRGE
ncbi:VOC family protein [Corallococcus caeni]|uniref:VOC family protein n=1 Tax=Corallococcus caeni TaxID=3082388 RepID=A0ABQ6QQ56_9BACT|nr:VOC family protein [Corallococcus sp. NO1]